MTRLLVAEIVEYAGRDFSVEADILGGSVDVHRFAFAVLLRGEVRTIHRYGTGATRVPEA